MTLKNLKKIEQILKDQGLISRLPVDAVSVFKFRKEYIENRNLIAWNFYDPSDPTNQVDILINHDVSDFSHEKFKVGDFVYKVISKDDLIRMKREAGREKDLMDIRELSK